MKNILTILIISFAFVLAAENPVLNPGFEAGIQNWLYAEECGNIAAYEGVDGGNAFLYRRDNPTDYGVLSQNLRLQQGKKYRVGAKLRNASNAPITVNMTLEYSRGSTYLGGNYFNGQLPQDGDAWQELSCEFTAGGDDLSYRLGIYLERGNTGSFYVDDV
jgi:hypothetical protein